MSTDPPTTHAGSPTTRRDRWLGIELRHLAALVAVAREGSFGAAADALGYVPSAVSQQISHLETLVDARLVVREPGSRGATLTPAGDVLLEHAGELLRRCERARDDLAARGEDAPLDAAEVRVGFAPGLTARWLPGLLAAGLRVQAVTVPDAAAVAVRLRDGLLDVTAGELPAVPPPGVAVEPLVDDPLVLVVAAGSPLARRAAPPTPAELARLALVGTGPAAVHDALVDWLAEHGVAPAFAVRCDAATAAQPLVAAGVGVAVCPRLALCGEQPGTVTVPLSHAPPARAIGLAVRRAAGPAADAVAAILRDQAASAARAAPASTAGR